MGVRTSSEVFPKNDNTGIVYVGGDPITKPSLDATNAYLFPAPLQGVSYVFLEIDGDQTEIKLKDGMFVLPKSWSKVKKDNYRNAFLEAGFMETSYQDGKAEKKPEVEKKYRYFAGHPENTHEFKKEGKFVITIDDNEIEFELVEGIAVTEDADVYGELISQGFYEAKPAEEIEEEK